MATHIQLLEPFVSSGFRFALFCGANVIKMLLVTESNHEYQSLGGIPELELPLEILLLVQGTRTVNMPVFLHDFFWGVVLRQMAGFFTLLRFKMVDYFLGGAQFGLMDIFNRHVFVVDHVNDLSFPLEPESKVPYIFRKVDLGVPDILENKTLGYAVGVKAENRDDRNNK